MSRKARPVDFALLVVSFAVVAWVGVIRL